MNTETPFIYLIKTPVNYYFFDVNKDMLVNIDYELYKYFNANNNNYDLSDESKAYLRLLRKEGFLEKNNCKIVKHPDLDRVEDLLDTDIGQLVLQVTQSCNLACAYCPYANTTNNRLQRNHSSRHMTYETAKKAVDFYLDHSCSNEKCVVSFYGGEPFLAFDLIRKIVDYVEKSAVGKDIKLNLTTNGTLLNDEILIYLNEHSFDIMFSIDGGKKVHDKNRHTVDGKGSFDKAISSLKRAIEIYGDSSIKKLSINMVLNPENDYDDILELFNEDMFIDGKVTVSATSADTEQLDKKLPISDSWVEKLRYQYFLGLLDYLSIIPDVKVVPFIKQYYQEMDKEYAMLKQPSHSIPEISAPGGPCIPGQRRLFVNVDGDFFPCERVSEVSSVMKIGTIDSGFEMESVRNLLNIGNITEKSCSNCWAHRHCTMCAREADGGAELSKEIKLSHCNAIRNDFELKLREFALFKEYRTGKMRFRSIGCEVK